MLLYVCTFDRLFWELYKFLYIIIIEMVLYCGRCKYICTCWGFGQAIYGKGGYTTGYNYGYGGICPYCMFGPGQCLCGGLGSRAICPMCNTYPCVCRPRKFYWSWFWICLYPHLHLIFKHFMQQQGKFIRGVLDTFWSSLKSKFANLDIWMTIRTFLHLYKKSMVGQIIHTSKSNSSGNSQNGSRLVLKMKALKIIDFDELIGEGSAKTEISVRTESCSRWFLTRKIQGARAHLQGL